MYTQRTGWGIVGVVPPFVGNNPITTPENRSADREVTGVTGQYTHNIDAKGRLFIPSKLREDLGGTFHVIAGQDHCLYIFSEERWNAWMEQLSTKSYSEIKTLRSVFANAADCEPDAQGRILIPARLRKWADLEKEVVVTGMFDRVEIWNARRWAEMDEEAFSSGALEAAMESMGL